MAIKISGTTVIDDSRNLVSVGVATVGSGNSATTLDGTTGTLNVGTGVTINGSAGDINISGILTVGQLSVPVQISSFDPSIGSISAGVSSDIIMTFSQTVGLGSTGFIDIVTGLNTDGGTLVERFGVNDSNVTLTNGGTTLTINPTSSFNYSAELHVNMSSGFVSANGSDFTGINTVGAAQTYYFTTSPLNLGDIYEGGYYICGAGGTRWIAATVGTHVNWYNRNTAITAAQSASGCTGWFIPSLGQMQNPGYTCRQYWNSPGLVWTNSTFPSNPSCFAYTVNFNTTCTFAYQKHTFMQAWSFRCVSY